MLSRCLAILLAGVALVIPSIHAQNQENLGLIPKPVSLERTAGAFALTAGTQILAAPGCIPEAWSLSQRLKSLTGFPFAVYRYAGGPVAGPCIILQLSPAAGSELGVEGYRLSIRQNQIVIEAPATAGLFYGGITLAQLAYPGSESRAGVAIPCAEITDYPRFAWRGMMLDCSRHFRSKEFIERFLDLMALQKMNHFHWHLVDSEGWRLEIRKYPKLTQVSDASPASYPSEDPHQPKGSAKYQYGHFHGGGYYSQNDVREIVAYAAARHIEIMPEIEFPAHSMAALTAYPEFGATGVVPTVKSSISTDLYNVDDKSLQFLRDALTEVMDLFPGKYLHFGGDEAPKGEWKQSPFVQAKIKELGLKDENALQSWLFE